MIDFNKLDELTVQIDELEEDFKNGIHNLDKIKNVVRKVKSVISDLYAFKPCTGEELPDDVREYFEKYIAQHPDEFVPHEEGWSVLRDSTQDERNIQRAADIVVVDAYMKGAYDLTKAINDGLYELLTRNLEVPD